MLISQQKKQYFFVIIICDFSRLHFYKNEKKSPRKHTNKSHEYQDFGEIFFVVKNQRNTNNINNLFFQ